MIVFKTGCLIGCKTEIAAGLGTLDGHPFEIIDQEIVIVTGKGIEICGVQHSHPIVTIEDQARTMMAAALLHWLASIPCHPPDEVVEALRHGANHG